MDPITNLHPPDEAAPERPTLDPELLLNALLAQSAVGITIVDRDLRIVRANRVFGVFGDESPDDVIGRTIAEVLPHLAPQIVPATIRVLETGEPTLEGEVVAPDATDPTKLCYYRSFRCPVLAADGSVVGVTSTVIEITDLKAAQVARDDALAHQRESDAAERQALTRYRAIFDGAAMGILRAHRSGRLIEANPAIEQMLGYSAAELAQMSFREYTHPDDIEQNLALFHDIMNGVRDSYQYEKRCFRKDGEMVWIRVTSVAEMDSDGHRDTSISMFEDITERKIAEEANRTQAALNEHQALHDALTGLGNRRKLYADVAGALGGDAERRLFALGIFDLDGFKAYNDSFGHPAGDALLARLGRRLADAVGQDGAAYRMGGDEFCVFTWTDESRRVLEDARHALSDQGDGFSISCSYGLALVPSEATSLERALQIADERLYIDKRGNKATETLQVRDALVQLIAEQRRELAIDAVNVADLAAAVATALGLSPVEIACTRIAAQLHDIGKTALPEAILNKAGPLDSEEWAFVQRHTLIGERIVAAAPALARIAPIVRASHERPDGTGYPDGLTIEEIPIGARIVAVVDAFGAMISDRPYKPAISNVEALSELRRCAGTQFDRAVVEAFVQIVELSRRELRAA